MPTLDYLLETTQITLPELAQRSGLELDRVTAIVEGRWTPSPEEREAIARSLNVPLESIAFGNNMNARNLRFYRFGLKEDFNPGKK